MTLALSLATKGRENLLSHLLISDIAPTRAALSDDFLKYIDAMHEINDLPLGIVRTRAEVDLRLYKHESVSISPFINFYVLIRPVGSGYPSIPLDEPCASEPTTKPQQTLLQPPIRYPQKGYPRVRVFSVRCY